MSNLKTVASLLLSVIEKEQPHKITVDKPDKITVIWKLDQTDSIHAIMVTIVSENRIDVKDQRSDNSYSFTITDFSFSKEQESANDNNDAITSLIIENLRAIVKGEVSLESPTDNFGIGSTPELKDKFKSDDQIGTKSKTTYGDDDEK